MIKKTPERMTVAVVKVDDRRLDARVTVTVYMAPPQQLGASIVDGTGGIRPRDPEPLQ